MKNVQIPRAEWVGFFREFSRRHEGWLATVQVVDPGLGAQVEVRNLPLEGIDVDARTEGPVTFFLGKGVGANVEHPIDRPAQVWVEETASGAEAALEILSEGGRKTILEFRTAMLPEDVDGLARDVPEVKR